MKNRRQPDSHVSREDEMRPARRQATSREVLSSLSAEVRQNFSGTKARLLHTFSVILHRFVVSIRNPYTSVMKENKEKYLLFIGVCAALIPVLLLRDFTPSNELRYLSIADEALRNHTFFAFTNHGAPYADKPPLYLWAIMLCRWLTGAHRMWLLSLFSLVPALCIVRTMSRWAAQETDAESRPLAQLMLLTSGFFIGAAVTLRMDMLMCLFIVLSLQVFWRMQKDTDGGGRCRWLFPLYLFLAVFTKGPLGLIIPLVGTAAYLAVSRRIREFFRYWGWRTWGVLVACCALWFGAVYADGGSDYLHNLLFHQTIDRAVNSFHHDRPFHYYAVSIWYCIAPWSLLVIGVMVAALRPKSPRSDLQRFFLTVGISTFVLLSCISAKLQIYLLPAFPFFIYAAILSLPRHYGSVWARVALAVPAVAFALALPALLLVPVSEELAYLHDGWIYAAAAILSLSGIASICLLCREGMPKAIRCMGTGLLIAVFTGGWALPKINVETGYGALCDKALELSAEHGIADFRTWHISRPENMDVYLRSTVGIIPDEEQPAVDSLKSCLLLTRKQYAGQFSGKEVRTVGSYAVVVCP